MMTLYCNITLCYMRNYLLLLLIAAFATLFGILSSKLDGLFRLVLTVLEYAIVFLDVIMFTFLTCNGIIDIIDNDYGKEHASPKHSAKHDYKHHIHLLWVSLPVCFVFLTARFMQWVLLWFSRTNEDYSLDTLFDVLFAVHLYILFYGGIMVIGVVIKHLLPTEMNWMNWMRWMRWK